MPNYEKDDDVSIQKDTTDIKYPLVSQNEIGNWLIFERKKFQKTDMFSTPTYENAENSRRVYLPVPPELSKNYSASWDQKSMGIWGNFVRETGGELMGEIKKAYKNQNDLSSFVDGLGNMSLKDLKDSAVNVAQRFGQESVKGAKALAKDALFNSNAFIETGAYTGMARNPYKAVLFDSPTFRTFQFSYKMMAKSYQEAIAIRDLIREFNVGMSPGFDDVFQNDIYSYPDLFMISFTDDSFLFQIAPCICKQCSVVYHSEGTPIYIGGPNGEQIPASVRVDLEFQETVILTKTDFENGKY